MKRLSTDISKPDVPQEFILAQTSHDFRGLRILQDQWKKLQEGDERIFVLLYIAFKSAGDNQKKWNKKDIEKFIKETDSTVRFDEIRDFFELKQGKYEIFFVRKIINFFAFSYCIQILEKGSEKQKGEIREFILQGVEAKEMLASIVEGVTENEVTAWPKPGLPKSLALFNKGLYDAWEQLTDDGAEKVLKDVAQFYINGFNKNNGRRYTFSGDEHPTFSPLTLAAYPKLCDFLMLMYTYILYQPGRLQQKHELLTYIVNNTQEEFLKLADELENSQNNDEFKKLADNLNEVLNFQGDAKIKISPAVSDFSTDLDEAEAKDTVWISANKTNWEQLSKGIKSEHQGGKVFSITLDKTVLLKDNLAVIKPIFRALNQTIHLKESQSYLSRAIRGSYAREMEILKEFRDYYLLDDLFDNGYSVTGRLTKFIGLRKSKWEKEGLSQTCILFLEQCTGITTGIVLEKKLIRTPINGDDSETEPLVTPPTIELSVEKKWKAIALPLLRFKDKELNAQFSEITKLEPEISTALMYLAFHFTFGAHEKSKAEIKRLLCDIDNVSDVKDISYLLWDAKTERYSLSISKKLAHFLVVFYLIEIVSKDDKEETRNALACLKQLSSEAMFECNQFLSKLKKQGAVIDEKIEEAFKLTSKVKYVEKALGVFLNTGEEQYKFSFLALEELESKFKLSNEFLENYINANPSFLCIKNQGKRIYFNQAITKGLVEGLAVPDFEGNKKSHKLRAREKYNVFVIRMEEEQITLENLAAYRGETPLIIQYRDGNGKIKLNLFTVDQQEVEQLIELPPDLLKHFYDFNITDEPVAITANAMKQALIRNLKLYNLIDESVLSPSEVVNTVDDEVHAFIQEQLQKTAKPYLLIPTSQEKIVLLFENLKSASKLQGTIVDKIKECGHTSTWSLFCCVPSEKSVMNQKTKSLLKEFHSFIWSEILQSTETDKKIEEPNILLEKFINSLRRCSKEHKMSYMKRLTDTLGSIVVDPKTSHTPQI